jgi:hypothetical protein
LREIEYVFDTLKADGIALTTNYIDKYPGDKAFAPVFDELNRRKAVVYFHPTAASFALNVVPEIPPPSIEFPFDTTRAIVSLLFGGTFTRCPNIKWIFSHGGGALAMIANRLVGLSRTRPELGARVPNGVKARAKSTLMWSRPRRRAQGGARHRADVAPVVRHDFPFWAPEAPPSRGWRDEALRRRLQAIERDNALKLLPGLRGSAAATWSASARSAAAPAAAVPELRSAGGAVAAVSSLAGISRACRSSRA